MCSPVLKFLRLPFKVVGIKFTGLPVIFSGRRVSAVLGSMVYNAYFMTLQFRIGQGGSCLYKGM